MGLKFSPDAAFEDNLEALLQEVLDSEVQAILREHIQAIINLAETNTQGRREQIVEDLRRLIGERTRKAVGL